MIAWLSEPLVSGPVVVRRPADGDEEALVRLFTDPDVRRFLGGPLDTGLAEQRAIRIVAAPAWGDFVIAVDTAAAVIGSGDISRKRGAWEVSYQLLPSSWGAGLASAALGVLINWFFAHTTEDVVIAVTQDSNEHSTRLLERNGATLTGKFGQYGAQQRQYEFRRPA